jgi:hypothetical protein
MSTSIIEGGLEACVTEPVLALPSLRLDRSEIMETSRERDSSTLRAMMAMVEAGLRAEVSGSCDAKCGLLKDASRYFVVDGWGHCIENAGNERRACWLGVGGLGRV